MPRKQDPLTMEYLLLGVISREPIHPYDLNKLLKSDPELKSIWHFEQSRLYALLDKLEKNGLISSKMEEGDAFPFRKVYHITREGKFLFSLWLQEPAAHHNELRSSFLAKLYFLREYPEELSDLTDRQIILCKEWAEKARYEGEGDYLQMLSAFRVTMIQAAIDWLEQIRKTYCNPMN